MDNKKDIKQLSKQLENVVKYAFPPAKPKCAAKTKKWSNKLSYKKYFIYLFVVTIFSHLF